jgi:ribosomal protein S18
MDKKTVISILTDQKQDKRQKFSMLLMALNQAPVKNFALTAHYNRVGYSDKNLKAIVYDVKKGHNISLLDLNAFEKTPVEKVEAPSQDNLNSEEKEVEETKADKEENKDKLKLESLNEELKAMDIENAEYNTIKKLAFGLANEINIDFPNKRADTLKAFLTEQKKSLANEA